MKKSASLLLMGATIFFAACNNDNKNTSTSTDSTVTTETNSTNAGMGADSMNSSSTSGGNAMAPAASTTPLNEMDKDFAMKAAKGGMMEIESSNIALQNSNNDRIKAYAQMMVTDHSKAGDQLKSIASAKGVMLPDSMDKKDRVHLEAMRKMKGAAFDKHYIQMMNSDHQKTVEMFKKGSSGLNDADLKNFATQTLPVIQMHTDSAKALAKMKM